MVFAVGDSHCRIYESIKGIHIRHIGARLMYSIATRGLKIPDGESENGYSDYGILEMGIGPSDIVIFCFGEIDCRFHVWKHSQTKPYEKVIDEIVEKYFKFLLETRDTYKIVICVHNVVPPYKISENEWQDPNFPFLGSNEERKSYILYMNKKLKEYCYRHDMPFIDVYNHYITTEGFLCSSKSDGGIHIIDSYYVNKFLIDHNIH